MKPALATVEDAASFGLLCTATDLTRASARVRTHAQRPNLGVTIPATEELIELVCTIAARIGSQSDALLAGATADGSGGDSVSYGSDAYRGTTSLLQEEKNVITRMFPRLPQQIVTSAG